jgi:hypothetical protein
MLLIKIGVGQLLNPYNLMSGTVVTRIALWHGL